MIYCLNCGKGIPDESKFCTFCGTPTPVVHPEQPNLATPPPTFRQPVDVSSSTVYTGKPKNEFYKNVGFWGALITLVGFFLPYVNTNDASFYYLVTDFAPDTPALYMYLVFPVSAAILVLQAITGALPKFLIAIFKVLPVLLLILFAVSISQNSSTFGFMGNDLESVLSNIGVGLYMTVIGTILMLFFRTTKVS